MDTVDLIKKELLKIDGLKGIVLLSHLEIEMIVDNLVLKVSTPTVDDAFILFHKYGRLLSRAARVHVDKIDIRVEGQTQYYFRPDYRLSFI